MTFPHIIDNFITEEECDHLLHVSKYCNAAFDDSTTDVNNERWKSRIAYQKHVKTYDPEAKDMMVNIAARVHHLFADIMPALNVYVEMPQFSRWQKGDRLDPPHIDNCEHDGRDNLTPWRHFGYVLYLNEDFDGGQLFYPNYNIEYEPKTAALAVHTAGPECMHGVREVTSGLRHTLIGFATINRRHYEEHPEAYYHDR